MLIGRLIDGRLSKTDVSKRERERVTRVVGATLGSRVETPQTATSRKGATRGRDAEREVRAAFLLPICELLI